MATVTEVYSQPTDVAQADKSTSVATITPGPTSDDSLSNDAAIIETNHDDYYLNPDLESLVNQRGFSTQRPEILGMFNYMAPLEEISDVADSGTSSATEQSGSIDSVTDAEYLITSAGELFDYQCQLKQLRYSDALGFFTKMLGFDLVEANEGHVLGPGTDTTESSKKSGWTTEELLENYTTQMDLAKETLEYLSLMYAFISAFIAAQEVQTTKYKIWQNSSNLTNIVKKSTSSSSRSLSSNASNTVYNQLLVKIPMIDNTYYESSFSSLKDDGSGTSIGDFLKEYILNGNLNGNEESDPDSDIANFNYNSGTTLMLQVMNIAAAGLQGIDCIRAGSWSEYTSNSLLGTKEFLTANNRFSKFFSVFTYSAEYNGGDIGESANYRLQIDRDGSREYASLIDSLMSDSTYDETGNETSEAGRGHLIHIAGLDFIQTIGSITSYVTANAAARPTKADASRAGPGSALENLGLLYTFNRDWETVDELILERFGRSVSESMSSILDNLPESGTNITSSIISRHLDGSDTDTRTAVENYTSTNYRLAQGVAESRSGRSYYCDEISTLEQTESVVRIGELINALGEMGNDIEEFGRASACFNAESEILPDISQIGYVTDPSLKALNIPMAGGSTTSTTESPIVGSTLYLYILNRMRSSFEDCLINVSRNETPTNSDLITVLAAAMASEDDDMMYYVTAYLFAYDDYYSGVVDKSTFTAAAQNLDFRICEKFQNDFIDALDNNESSVWENEVMTSTSSGGDTAKRSDDASSSEWLDNAGWIPYGRGRRPDDAVYFSDSLISHKYKKSSLPSDYVFFPYTGNGPEYYVEGSADARHQIREAWGDDDPHAYLRVMVENLGGGSKTESVENNFLLGVYHAILDFEKDVCSANGVTWSESGMQNESVRGLSRKNRILAALGACKELWNMGLRASWYHQEWSGRCQYGKADSQGWENGPAWLYIFNMRSAQSLRDAIDIYFQGPAGITGTNYDPFTLKTFRDSWLGDQDKAKIFDDWRESGEYGYVVSIEEILSVIHSVYEVALSKERIAFGSLMLAASALDSLTTAASELYTVISSSDIESGSFQNVLGDIQSDPDFGEAALLAFTRDQLLLNRALYDSFAVPNREYPYLPASKAIMTNQSKNLAGFMKTSDMLQKISTGRRFIMPVGLPAGLLEALRLRMMDATGDLNYRYSDIVEISVWKRNLLDDSLMYEPNRYVFDTSKFIIEGRPEGTAVESDEIDAAVNSPDPQDFERVLADMVVRSYEPDGNVNTWTGYMSDNRFRSDEYGVDSEEIFYNHGVDYHLKLFMRMTTGFDLSEDVFPFLEGNVFFDGADPDQKDLFDEISEQAKEMFVDIDLESAINYDRLVGELSRSIILSAEKYRNRIVYPKVFERVLCIFVQPDEFELSNGSLDEDDPESTAASDLTNNEYAQYYVTIKLLPRGPSSGYAADVDYTITDNPERVGGGGTGS
jgi:hypothetical protein